MRLPHQELRRRDDLWDAAGELPRPWKTATPPSLSTSNWSDGNRVYPTSCRSSTAASCRGPEDVSSRSILARPLALRDSTAMPRTSACMRPALRSAAVIPASGNRTVQSRVSSSSSPPLRYGVVPGAGKYFDFENGALVLNGKAA